MKPKQLKQLLLGLVVGIGFLAVPGVLYVVSHHAPSVISVHQDCDTIGVCWYVVLYDNGLTEHCSACEQDKDGNDQWSCIQCRIVDAPTGGK